MSYLLGRRIAELRCEKKVTQDKMAEILDTTRQRYARLEKGQIDISYVMIKKIADCFGVSPSTITQAEEEKKGISDDIRDVYAEAKAVGYDVKIMRQIVRLRKMSPDDRREMEAVLDLYKAALGLG